MSNESPPFNSPAVSPRHSSDSEGNEYTEENEYIVIENDYISPLSSSSSTTTETTNTQTTTASTGTNTTDTIGTRRKRRMAIRDFSRSPTATTTTTNFNKKDTSMNRSPISNKDNERKKNIFNNGTEEIENDYTSRSSSLLRSMSRFGQPVENSDREYELMNSIYRGISRMFKTNEIMAQERKGQYALTQEDYYIDTAFTFRDTGLEFKVICPKVFQRLRNRFNINDIIFEEQLIGKTGNFTRVGSAGRSGALFFYSPSMQYVLKTVTDEEYSSLMEMLPNYVKHVTEQAYTFLSQFYLLFEVSLKNSQRFRFLVMNNVFCADLTLDFRYDLKGSTANRTASEAERRKPNPLLKDNDIKFGAIKLTHSAKLEFYKVSSNDCRFLCENGIIDYSLLLGVHVVKNINDNQEIYHKFIYQSKKDWTGEFRNCISSRDGSKIYFFGIVDILQRFNSRKLFEKVVKSGVEKVKSKIKSLDRAEKISVARPRKYARRFDQFMKILCTDLTIDSYGVGSIESFEKMDEAEEFYNLLVRNNTHDTRALFYRAIFYHKKFGNQWNALEDLNKSIKVDPSYSNVRCYLWRGMLYTEMGELESAIRDFNKLIEMNAHCADAYLMRGILYHKHLRQYSLADRDYSKSIECNPNAIDPYNFMAAIRKMGVNPPNAYLQRGILFLEQNQKEKALLEFKRAIDVDPKRVAHVYVEIGKLFQKFDDENEAMLHYNMAIKSDSSLCEAYLTRASLQRQPELAIKDYTTAIDLNPKCGEAYFNRAVLYAEEMNDIENAIRDLSEVITLNPTNARYYANRGRLYQKLKDLSNAESDFLKAVELENKFIDVYNDLTEFYLLPEINNVEKSHFWTNVKLDLLMASEDMGHVRETSKLWT